MNAFWLLYFGRCLEKKLGVTKFILFFIITCVTTSLNFFFFDSTFGNAVGLSGVLSGILGFYFYEIFILKHPNRSNVLMLDKKPFILFLVIFLVLNFFKNVCVSGHIGGFIGGLVFALIYFHSKKAYVSNEA